MSGLFGTISISLRALLAQQAAIETSSQNIANITTPGYTRRRVIMQEDASWTSSALEPGKGVQVAGIESLRDRVLELRIQSELQKQARDDSFVQSMRPIELLLGTASTGLGADINKFFNSLQKLSAAPTDPTHRAAVLMAAQDLAASFRSTASGISAVNQHVETELSQSLQEINRLTAQIAALNTQVAARQQIGADAAALEDQRGLLMRQLSELVDFSTVDDPSGLTLTTSNGAPLVVAGRSVDLTTVTGPDGRSQIFSLDRNVTESITGGKLGGLLAVRDQQLRTLSSEIDTLAYSLAERINQVHRGGFDFAGSAGLDLFTTSATSGGAARCMQVAFTDPALLAASSDGTPGSNGNLLSLVSVATAPLLSGRSPIDAYAQIVFSVGSVIANTGSNAQASQLVVQQLENQRNAVSGVSLDEEAAHLIRFERAYQAAARVISVTNDLLDSVINLGR